MVVMALAMNVPGVWALTALAAMEAVVAYAAGSLFVGQFARSSSAVRAIGAISAAFVAELGVIAAAHVAADSILPLATLAHVANLSLILWLAWQQGWPSVGMAAVVPAWLATAVWQSDHSAAGDWRGTLAFAAVLYALFAAYPLDPPSAGAQGSRTVSDGHSGSRLFLLHGPATRFSSANSARSSG